MKLLQTILAILLFNITCHAQSKSIEIQKKDILQVFVGEWEGEATAYFPRNDQKPNRLEKVQATGISVLKNSYVEIQSTWTQSNGDYRELLTLWNYHIKKDSFQILYLYDNWPGRVDYPLGLDSTSLTFRGYDTFIAKGNVPAEEKVEWTISNDGTEIRSIEYNHLATDPEDYWPKTFEFVLKKKE